MQLQESKNQAPRLPAFRSDPSCFSPLSDRKGIAPVCAHCGEPSLGASFLDIDSGYPMGQVTGTAEFSCGCDGRTIFSLTSANIASWQLYKSIRPGVWRVRKRTEGERIKEIQEKHAAG